MQTILAMPFVLDGSVGETVIEARGIAHCIRFTVDPIRQEPRIACDRATSSVKNGTRVTVRWPMKASHLLDDAIADFLPLLWSVVATNPHATIRFDLDGKTLIDWNEPSAAVWNKWRPSDPLPAHWFTPERLQRLIAAHVARDREHGAVRSVRNFIAETFHGLTGTAKLAAILKETDLARARLDAFFDGDRVDQAGIARLLMAMQRHSRAVKPEALGLIGEDHLRKIFDVEAAYQEKFRYKRALGTDSAGLPYVVEAAFAPTAEVSSTPRITGVNFSAAIGDPFSRLDSYRSLHGVLTRSAGLHP